MKMLDGVKVIELSTYAAAPAAGRILAEMGAQVIKVEALQGDPFRHYGTSIGVPATEEENPCFELENMGKQSVCINLATQQGKQIFYQLLEESNLFLTNMRQEALQRLGISYEEVSARFPKLIYGHLVGYGLKGEDAALPGFDSTAFWARGGGTLDLPFAGSGPLSTPYAVGDHTAALALVAGLAGALYQQAVHGRGEHIVVSLFGVSIFVNSLCILPGNEGYAPQTYPMERSQPVSPVQTTYLCEDGVGLTLTFINHEKYWPVFCTRVIEHPEWAEDARYCTIEAAKQPENNERMYYLLRDIFLTAPSDHWIRLLKEADLPFGKVQHFRDVLHDETAWENGYLQQISFSNHHQAAIAAIPIQSGQEKNTAKMAPGKGEDTLAVLQSLGYDAQTLRQMNGTSIYIEPKIE